MMDEERLREMLEAEFPTADSSTVDTVVKNSHRLNDYQDEDSDLDVTADLIEKQLNQSGKSTLSDAWNWWIGSLEFLGNAKADFKI